MSDTVVIFDPQGTSHDVPPEQVKAALQNGGKPGVRMQTPDGSVRIIPSDRMNEGIQNGGKLLPFEQQETEHPGFWDAVKQDIGPAVKGIGLTLAGGPFYQSYRAVKEGLDQLKSVRETGKTLQQRHADEQKAAGYGPTYRYLTTPAAEGVGVNVRGMEQSAAQGDISGVMGHTAVPTATLAAAVALPRVLPAAAKAVPPTVRGAAKATNIMLEKAPGTIGAGIGGGLGGYLGGRYGAEIGAAGGYAVGREVLGNLRVPGERFGLPPENPPAPAIPAPSETAPSAVPRAQFSKALDSELRQAVGNKLPQPGQPIYRRPTVTPQATAEAPAGFTAVDDSSAVRAFRYDPSAQEMHITDKGGTTHVYAEVTPEQAAAFRNAESKGLAWKAIRDNNVAVAKISPAGVRTASKGASALRSAAPEGQTAGASDLVSLKNLR